MTRSMLTTTGAKRAAMAAMSGSDAEAAAGETATEGAVWARRVAGADASDIETWKTDGLKILAVRRDNGKILSPREFSGGLAQGDSAVIAGPEVNVRLYLMFEGFDLD